VESSVVLVALAAIGILTALVVVAWRFGSDTPETAIPDFSSQPPAASPAKTPKKPEKTKPALARLSVTGALGSSWMEVHAASPAGRELYRGTLEAGSTVRFSRPRLYLVIGRPGNLRFRLNGRVVEVADRGSPTSVLITPKRVTPVDNSA
jgi:hypothetical protein